LKSTIPEGVAEALKLNHGDSVDWSIEVKDGQLVVVVKKVEG
jgi:antitoxin component of MazEF toxin-antitoxin module